MKIAISGSTGFIGKQLSEFLLQSGNELIVISRSDFAGGRNRLAKVIKSADVIINLAGASVLRRWNEKNKQVIFSSRVVTTQLLVKAVQMNLAENRPRVFINASAIGIYEINKSHDEFSIMLGTDFLAVVCKAWEGVTVDLKEVDMRLCTIRIGIVLGTTGGSLRKLLPLFKAGLGGKIASGKQPFSFIHISDFCNAIWHLIINGGSVGIYNLVCPELTTNKLFTNTLANYLHRPAIFTVPEFALKLIYGEAAGMLTTGAKVISARLPDEGFQFKFPDINSAIADLIKNE